MTKRLPPHITEDDVRQIAQMITPTVVAAVRADVRKYLLDHNRWQTLDWLAIELPEAADD